VPQGRVKRGGWEAVLYCVHTCVRAKCVLLRIVIHSLRVQILIVHALNIVLSNFVRHLYGL